MKLVENQQFDPLKCGIVLDHARQDSLRNDFDFRLFPRHRLKPCAVADPFSGNFPQQMRNPFCGAPRGYSARFQHQDLSTAEKRRIQKRRRNHRAFPRAGSRAENGITPPVQCLFQSIKAVFYGKSGIQSHAWTFRRSVSMTSTARPRRKISVTEFVYADSCRLTSMIFAP